MGKHKDIIQLLLLILIGMFVPFLGSITIIYGFKPDKIGVAFAYFLVIFGIELTLVYFYFSAGSKKANIKMAKYRPKKEDEESEDL